MSSTSKPLKSSPIYTESAAEAQKTFQVDESCMKCDILNTEEKPRGTEDVKEDEIIASQKTASMKTLTEGHSTLKANLLSAQTVLREKTGYLKDHDKVARQKEQNWLLGEKIRSLTERECQTVRNADAKEKRLECIFKEISNSKWKLHEAKNFLKKSNPDQAKMKKMQEDWKETILELDNINENNGEGGSVCNLKVLHEEIQLLESYKNRLEAGDVELLSIQNGTKMLELEERKRELQELIGESNCRTDAMYLEIDELNENIQAKTKVIRDTKKENESKLLQLTSQLQCLIETESRLQRSSEYLHSKIDYDMEVPGP